MLHIRRLEKTYPHPDGPLAVLRGLDLDIEAHAIVSIVGASGCGKSTLLRIISGLEPATRGDIRLDDAPVTGPRPEIGLVFQEPRLMPWLSVRDNVRFGLGHLGRAEQRMRADAALDAVGLNQFATSLPKTLSGGMAQRVALARALARKPEILLLDEPFSALDAFTRASLQDHLLRLWRHARFTALFVTHDVEEAAYLSDRVLLLKGRPGAVGLDLTVALPRPRDRDDPRLQILRRRLTQALADPSAAA